MRRAMLRRIGIVIVVLVVTVALGRFAAAEPGGDGRLSLELIFGSEELLGHGPEGLMWLPDGSGFIFRLESQDEDGATALWHEDAKTGQRRMIADWDSLMARLRAERPGSERPLVHPVERASRAGLSSALSPDGDLLVGLVAGDLYLLDLTTGTARFLTDDSEAELFPAFSPDGTMIAFNRGGDLYWIGLADGVVHRLTDRGESEHILNGIADWVYEEELGISTSFWWAPDSSRIAYVSYDTSPIGVFPITDELSGIYAGLEQQRYPKAGTANSIVRLGVITLESGETRWIDTDGPGVGEADRQDFMLARAGWTPGGESIWYQWLSRDQRRLELRLGDPRTGDLTTVLTEHDEAWINVFDDLYWIDDQRLVWSSERDGWRHLYLYTVADGRAELERRLTEGDWEVREVYGLDASGSRLLIQATEKSPLERHIYAVDLSLSGDDAGTGLRRLSQEPGSHAATLSPDGELFLDEMSDLDTPTRLVLRRSDGSLVRVVDSGEIPALADHVLPRLELGAVEAEDGTTLYTCTVRPRNLDETRQYPVLLYVYGGPSSQLVRRFWGGRRHLFFQYLAQNGIVVHWADNRGTTARGRDFERAVHRRLGELELQDQLAAVRELVKQPWVDPGRIGIYGGSYGGFMTLMGLLKAPEVFRAGIAYAPGTDWSLYDTIWTERYMDTPADNPEGYRASSPTSMADQLQGRLLLVHGTMDNNVHLQHSIELIDALVRHGKVFDLMIYPRVRHGIRVSRHRLHFHRLKTQFLLEHLVGGSDPRPAVPH